MAFWQDKFQISGRGSSLGREILGGFTTYFTMAYIVFVQPVVLAKAGMDFGAVMMATCLASGLACLVMGLYANYPVALAPGMGTNFFFAYAVVLGMHLAWPQALGATLVAGLIFLALSLAGLRERLINAIPATLLDAIGAGIGLMIAFVGLQWSGLVVAHPGTLVGLGRLSEPPVLLAIFGLALTSILWAWGVRGAILIGILASAGLALATGLMHLEGLVSLPPSLSPTLGRLSLSGVWSSRFWEVVLVFLFLDIFDTTGTLVAVGRESGFYRDGRLQGAGRALFSDALGTVVGAFLGTSTITSYVESAAGIQSGARTGLAAVVTGLLLILTPFLYPLVKAVGAGVSSGGHLLHPVTAPALILVGVMMMKAVGRIPWQEPDQAIPAFLTIVVMQLSISITEGIAMGFISYCLLALARGRGGRVPWPIYLTAAFFLLRYLFLR